LANIVKPLIVFGSHVFDPHTGTLRRGREGRDLQSQPAQLLALLLEHAGEVVTREQIRERLWPDTNVAYDQNINFAIRQIRVALDLDATLVQTVPRRGYRFVGEVTEETIDHSGVSRRSIAVAAAVIGALAAGFGAGIVIRDGPVGQFVYDHLVHPDRCPYVRMLLPSHRNS
jgi:DNA-binding winged helix-turn-helix (wHTH) protein